MIPTPYETVSEAVNDLQNKGYTTNLSLWAEKGCLICQNPAIELSPDEFEIDEIYRFEGMTDPGDEMIVMAISSDKHNIKGLIVNAFGTYSDSAIAKITARLSRYPD